MSGNSHGPAFPRDIQERMIELSRRAEPFAGLLVLQAEGSSPCGPGARALVTADGQLLGTIGGGLLEAEAHRRARLALHTGRPEVFDFDLLGEALDGAQPICGGRVRVLVDPTSASHAAAYAAAVTARGLREPGALLTTVEQDADLRVGVEFVGYAAAAAPAGLPEIRILHQAIRREEPVLIQLPPGNPTAKRQLFIEPVVARPELVIVGGGHVGQALAVQAALVGFDLRVVDDRPEFTRPELFPPGTAIGCGPIAEELGRVKMDARTFVVIVTRGHRHDAEALEHCLPRSAGYVGMIGSRRKVTMMRQAFLETGRATMEELDRVHAPIGIDIGSVTPPEIAVSIVAELVAVRRAGDGGHRNRRPL